MYASRFMAGIGRVVLAAAAAIGISSAASAETTLDKVLRTKTMTVANSFAYAPFGYVENGKPSGFDVDLGEEIARRMGVEVKWEKIDFKGIIAALTSGRVDALITAMTWSPERAERILFSAPYYDAGIGAAYREGKPIAKPEELAGKVVGLQLGSAGDRWTRDNYGSAVKEIKSYDEILLALKDLDSGRVEVVVSALPAVKYAMRNMPAIRVTPVWDGRVVGINTRKDDTALMAEFDSHLAALKAEGFLDKLEAKWFGPAKSAMAAQ
ncbi:substrate-binding periplasmic protein [Arenibaculum pallidiluteum]|uniref:substrate-binding periplasmic protein n=1 Tax=Arenibaculum pallidiluteum TaxID=2812559 RepID=UPI001A959CB0|nr:transporter substrate-binding domain-containing protein [Arenibaculum pallidiluteum]